MKLIEISKTVWVDPSDISSMEYEDYGSGYYQSSIYGVTLTLKCGRKILCKGETLESITIKIRDKR